MLTVNIDSFSYSNTIILKNIAFSAEPGEHISILGESGSGKSTLLHLIYGLLHLDDGQIIYKNKKLLGPEKALIPGEPFMKLVAQEFNIMPYSTVRENVYSHLSGINQIEDENRIDQLLEIVGLSTYKNTLVKYLSGGQKQRVALAKALADEPEILLLDEPFSNVDFFRKNGLRRMLFRYLKENDIMCISATHDSDEALAFSDRILMLKEGRQVRFDNPEKLYKSVENTYQAGFFGEAICIPKKFFGEGKSDEKKIVYASDLVISKDKTPLQVKVIESFFQGNYFLIQSDWEGTEVFFYHKTRLKAGEEYFLMLTKRNS